MARGQASKAEIEFRVQACARIIGQGGTRTDCIRYCSDQWGVGTRQTEVYISRARQQLREDWAIDRQTFCAELLQQLSTLQKEARRMHNPNVALGCINSAARLAKLIS